MDCLADTGGRAATVLSAGQTKRFAQYPQQRRIGIYVRIELFAVNFESDHDSIPFCPADRRIYFSLIVNLESETVNSGKGGRSPPLQGDHIVRDTPDFLNSLS